MHQPDTRLVVHHEGMLHAYARNDTHSLLVTMRNGVHRDMQLLIDLPERRIRRIYDGQTSWTVFGTGLPFKLHCRLGTIKWKNREEEEVRRADTPGFRLDWLNGVHELQVQAKKHATRRRTRRRTRSSHRPNRSTRRR